jgi:hypothetical protein
MGLQTITVKLPQALYHRLERAAEMTNQPLDAVLLQTIRGNIPPSLEDVPPELRAELAAMLQLSDDDLCAVAQGPIDSKKWRRHHRLLEKNAASTLGERDRQEMERLRTEVDRHVLRTSFALALLKWRGHTFPPPTAPARHGSA